VLREAERQGKPWTQLSLEDVKKFSPLFEQDFLAAPSVESSLATKAVSGGTAPDAVRSAMAELQNRIAGLNTKLNSKIGDKP
jgi:argininosuccinate lyase